MPRLYKTRDDPGENPDKLLDAVVSQSEIVDDAENEQNWEEISETGSIHLPEESIRISVNEDRDSTEVEETSDVSLRRARELRTVCHKTHLICEVANLQHLNECVNHDKVKDAVAASVPPELKLQQGSKNRLVGHLFVWYQRTFRLCKEDVLPDDFFMPEGLDVRQSRQLTRKRLLEVIRTQSGTYEELACVFVALCRAFDVSARIVKPLRPLDYRMNKNTYIRTDAPNMRALAEQMSNLWTAHIQQTTGLVQDSVDRISPVKQWVSPSDQASGREQSPMTHWVELKLDEGPTRRWIMYDPISGISDKPMQVEAKLKRQLTYVVGVDNTGNIRDVTARYATNWLHRTQKERPDGTWWSQLIAKLDNTKTIEQENEDILLTSAHMSGPLPTKMQDYRNHPMYAMAKFVGTYEVIHPMQPILGRIKGEAIYPRANVRKLRSKEGWLKMAKVLKEDATPIKTAKRKNKEDQELFGEWQTEKYIPPSAENGRVPKNRYGFVDLFQPSMLPKNCIHILARKSDTIAKKLGIDFAKAVVDFEYQSGRMVPITKGIVVCQETEDFILAGIAEYEAMEARKLAEAKSKRTVGNWSRICRLLIHRDRIQRQFNYKKYVQEEQERKRRMAVSERSEQIQKAARVDHVHEFEDIGHDDDGNMIRKCGCGYIEVSEEM
eukprot:Clim_evm60s149 gene=Clim_evmTU60s149